MLWFIIDDFHKYLFNILQKLTLITNLTEVRYMYNKMIA